MPPAPDARADDRDSLDGADEPLIAGDGARAHTVEDDDSDDQAASGATWFAWQLSLTAALSGLQFGYECVPTTAP
jgi:hypothetical protein